MTLQERRGSQGGGCHPPPAAADLPSFLFGPLYIYFFFFFEVPTPHSDQDGENLSLKRGKKHMNKLISDDDPTLEKTKQSTEIQNVCIGEGQC